jgi:hypothetical protein
MADVLDETELDHAVAHTHGASQQVLGGRGATGPRGV